MVLKPEAAGAEEGLDMFQYVLSNLLSAGWTRSSQHIHVIWEWWTERIFQFKIEGWFVTLAKPSDSTFLIYSNKKNIFLITTCQVQCSWARSRTQGQHRVWCTIVNASLRKQTLKNCKRNFQPSFIVRYLKQSLFECSEMLYTFLPTWFSYHLWDKAASLCLSIIYVYFPSFPQFLTLYYYYSKSNSLVWESFRVGQK